MDNKELAINKAKLLKKYIEGTASNSERRQIEKWAIDDDFLFEAIEGAQLNTPQQNAAALRGIHDVIDVNRRTINKRFWLMAASIVLLFSVYGLYKMQHPSLDNQMAIVENQEVDASAKEAKTQDYTVTPNLENTNNKLNNIQTFDENSKIEKSSRAKAKTNKKKSPVPNKRSSNIQKELTKETTTIETKPAQKETSNVEPKMKPDLKDLDMEVDEIQTSKDVSNDESDESMEPLEDEVTHSDEKIEDNISNIPVEQKTGKARGRDGALDYMEASIKYDSTSTPTIGFSAYEEYIRNNKNTLPFSGYARGNVVVQFRVSPSGQLSQFRILKSMSKNLDEEAIRLIKNGCGWTNTNKTKEIVTSYSVTFY